MSGRLRAFGWSLAFLGGGFALALSGIAVVAVLARPVLPGGALSQAWVQTAVLLAVFAFLTWIIGRRALGLTAGDLGIAPAGPGLRGFGRGFVVGAVLAGLAMAAGVISGGAAWHDDGGSITSWVGVLLSTAAFLLPAALVEELMFRGVPMVALSRAFGRPAALVGLAVLFAAAHVRNEGITPLALLNIALAGVFLGFAFFTRGGLWTSTGAHVGWNLTLAGLAAPVSGFLLPIPWLDYTTRGPAWLTGGGFGPEGGVLASLCLGAGALVEMRRSKRESIG